LLAVLPGTVSAARSTRYHDHHVGFFCETAIDGGYAVASIDSSSAFGDFAAANVWLDPAVPFESDPSINGSTDTVSVTTGTTETALSATFDVFDSVGNPLGTAVVQGTMTPVGDPQPINETNHGKFHSRTTGTTQQFEAAATLTLPGQTIEFAGCTGDVTDVTVQESDPAFVEKNAGVSIDCHWRTPDVAADFFVVQDRFGFTSFTSLTTADQTLFDTGASTGSLSATSLTASIPLVDEITGDSYSAEAAATLMSTGSPVTSTQLSQTTRRKLTEQALIPVGQLVFSSGQSFDLDEAHCRSESFANQVIATNPVGPKPTGTAPTNDTAAGALVVKAGTKVSVQTGATAAQPEVQVETCPEGFADEFGHTVWYKITGTGAPVTIDTAGSNFDTVVGVFERDGADYTEVACNDDVESEPVGSSYQAALTFDTVAGQTYYIEVGGFQSFFDPNDIEFGLLKLKVS
jgi:hypothetical protein